MRLYRALVLAGAGLVAGVVHAALLDVDSRGNLRRWDLLTPEAHVPPDAYIRVSTNVVNPATRSVRYYLEATGYSGTNATAELNAIRAAIDQWQTTPNTLLKFEEAGLLSDPPPINPDDHTNVVFWVDNANLLGGGTVDPLSLLAVTFFSTADNLMTGADIALNGDPGLGPVWYTDLDQPPPVVYAHFIEAIALHELGHFIGLEHAPLGGATMFYRDPGGASPYLGLSADDRLGVLQLYPASGAAAARGRIAGAVTMGGLGLLGAVVVADDASGCVAAATLTRTDGTYELPLLLAGTYGLRVCPLDPRYSFGDYLVRGIDILAPDYADANGYFIPIGTAPVTLQANMTRTANFSVVNAVPPLRIRGIRTATASLDHPFPSDGTARVRVGGSNFVVGVYTEESPAGATLEVTGAGVTLREQAITELAGYYLTYARVDVSRDAVPGLRSFVLRRGAEVSYANGFFEVLPAQTDDNLDRLDDGFQRRYFPRWTAPAAGPTADPDADGFTNNYEYGAGSNPLDPASLPAIAIERVTLTGNGAVIRWPGIPGAVYRLYARDSFDPGTAWQPVGLPVTATTAQTEATDPDAGPTFRFYRVLALGDR